MIKAELGVGTWRTTVPKVMAMFGTDHATVRDMADVLHPMDAVHFAVEVGFLLVDPCIPKDERDDIKSTALEIIDQLDLDCALADLNADAELHARRTVTTARFMIKDPQQPRWSPVGKLAGKGDCFKREEVRSSLVAHNERFVASLIVGWEGGRGEHEVASVDVAASLFRDEMKHGCVFYVHDRLTGQTKEFEV